MQQASAQKENTLTLPFTPFSQQQDQEAVSEEGQQPTTLTNQTTSNATNGGTPSQSAEEVERYA